MCSRTVSDTANRLLKRTDSEGSSSVAEKKSSAVPLFRSGHMSAICAGLGSKGKVGVQRGRETAGVPSFLPPRRAPHSPALRRAQLPAASQRKTLRPSGANPLTQFEYPAQPVQKKVPPVRDEPADAVRVPQSAGAEKGAARQGEPPARFKYPAQPVQKKVPPVRGEHACGSSRAPFSRC